MPIITENNYTFTSADGATPIHVREWVPDCDINGVVQLSHGINEYIGRYADFARFLASKGFVVVGNDHLGHGESVLGTEQAARYCRAVYEAGFSPICPTLYLPLFLNDAVPEEHKNGIDMSRDLLRRSHVLVVCGHTVTEAMKNDIAVAQRLGITATTLEGILTVKGQGRR